jgi:hypothetical protein
MVLRWKQAGFCKMAGATASHGIQTKRNPSHCRRPQAGCHQRLFLFRPWFSAVDVLCPSLLHRLVSIVPLRGKGDLRAMVGDRVRLRNARRTFAAMSATNRRMRSNRISRNLRAGKAGHRGGRAHGTSDHLTQGTDREHGHRDRQQEIAGPMRRSGTARDLRNALKAGSAGANRSCSSVRRSNCRSTR